MIIAWPHSKVFGFTANLLSCIKNASHLVIHMVGAWLECVALGLCKRGNKGCKVSQVWKWVLPCRVLPCCLKGGSGFRVYITINTVSRVSPCVYIWHNQQSSSWVMRNIFSIEAYSLWFLYSYTDSRSSKVTCSNLTEACMWVLFFINSFHSWFTPSLTCWLQNKLLSVHSFIQTFIQQVL